MQATCAACYLSVRQTDRQPHGVLSAPLSFRRTRRTDRRTTPRPSRLGVTTTLDPRRQSVYAAGGGGEQVAAPCARTHARTLMSQPSSPVRGRQHSQLRCPRYVTSPNTPTSVRNDTASPFAASHGVVVNFDLGDGFRDLGPSNGRACAPAHARRVAVLGVGAGGGRPLPLKGSAGVTPVKFFEIFDAKSRVWGNLGQKIN